MPILPSILQNQAQKEQAITQNFIATSNAAKFAQSNPGTTGLTFAYYGGYEANASGVEQLVPNGSVVLTASATNYVEYAPATNTVIRNTTAFTAGNKALYKITTNANTITNIEPHINFVIQPWNSGLSGGGGGGSVATAEVFKATAVNGRVVTLRLGRWSVSPPSGTVNIPTSGDVNITLTASTTGYIYLNPVGTGNFGSTTGGSAVPPNYLPLYYYVTDSNSVTTLEDLSRSFKNYSNNPFAELYQSTWAVGTEYSKVTSFTYYNTGLTSTNLFPSPPMLYCKTSELGYSVGDQVFIIENPYQIMIRSGAIFIVTHTSIPKILSRVTGSIGVPTAITPANWGLLVTLKPAQ